MGQCDATLTTRPLRKDTAYLCRNDSPFSAGLVFFDLAMKNAVLLFLLLAACNPKRLDTAGMAQEMRDRQPKRVTPSQLAALADAWGRQLTDSLSQRPPARLSDTAQTGPLARRYGANVRFSTLDQLASESDPKVREVAAAYRYAVNNRLNVEPNLQKLADGDAWFYTAPVRRGDSLVGFWAITFPRKELIRRVDTKGLQRLKTAE